jgi:hypothetical protein
MLGKRYTDQFKVEAVKQTEFQMKIAVEADFQVCFFSSFVRINSIRDAIEPSSGEVVRFR